MRWLGLLLVLALAGCAVKPGALPAQTAQEELYRQGRAQLEDGAYHQASLTLQRLLRGYPRGPFHDRGVLALAYAQLQLGQKEAVVGLVQPLIDKGPAQAGGDYALYLKANALLAGQPSWAHRLAAQEALARLLAQFPDSGYRPAAATLHQSLSDQLAQRELLAAQQLLREGQSAGALNRARYLIETYPETGAVNGALEVMVAAYRQLGLEQLAETTRSIADGRELDGGRSLPGPD